MNRRSDGFSEQGFEHYKLVDKFLDQDPAYQASRRITATDTELFLWHATEMPDRTVVFHHYSRPARLWAADITPSGIAWAEAQIEGITTDRMSVRYLGVRFPLSRSKLSFFGAMSRGVRFVTERTGWTAAFCERLRFEWYSGLVGLCARSNGARRSPAIGWLTATLLNLSRPGPLHQDRADR